MKQYVLLLILLTNCDPRTESISIATLPIENIVPDNKIDIPGFTPDHIAYHFDYPIGAPNAEGYYNAQKFGENDHLGEDWNGTGGKNTDLGDPIYAIANGYINFAEDIHSGWGKVIRIQHVLSDSSIVESLYAHCDTILTHPNQWIEKGQQIATIGTAHGIYYAHLHLEIRDNDTLGIGDGYASQKGGYLDPSKFIDDHR